MPLEGFMGQTAFVIIAGYAIWTQCSVLFGPQGP